MYAEDNVSPIIVEPIYPDNQVKSVQGYFRLIVKPNQQQTIHLRVLNQSNAERKIMIQPANGFTNPVGGMLYSDTLESNKSILLEDAIKLTPYLHMEYEEMTLKPKEEKEIAIDISVPNKDEGTILGAVKLILEGDPAKNSVELNEGEANFVLKTETVYAVAIQLDLPKTTTPNFSLGDAGFNSNGPVVYTEMTNDAQLIQENISGEYRVADSQGNQLFAGEIPPFKMAPKSQIQYPIMWNYEKLEQGDYKLYVKLNVNNEDVTVENDFTIGREEINEYVEKTQPSISASEVNSGIPSWVWIIVGAMVLSAFMFWLGRRK